MTKAIRHRIADWHGCAAAQAWMDYRRWDKPEDFDRYLRHVAIADRLWR